jgi:4-hydroxy-tetrahydrodipicolinate synthase
MTACPTATPGRPFGRVLTAMVTPFDDDGKVDLTLAQELASYLVDHVGNDGLVVNGTTGESPTTTDEEKERLLSAVVEAVGDRATVVAGAGTNDTMHSVELAQTAEKAGAHGLLVVTPYYSRPPQEGLQAHFTTVADATELPVMLYDVPARTGVAMAPSTLVELAAHPRIRAVKDAKGDLSEAMTVMSRTSLAYYCGIDELNLPYLACGAAGLVSVVANVAADRTADLIRAVRDGDLVKARAVNDGLIPLTDSIMRAGTGAANAKAALAELGIIPHATVRLPLVEAAAGTPTRAIPTPS